MNCNFGHTWEWNGQCWICEDCGMVASSRNPQIEPCLICGGNVDAQEAICEVCNG